ncbi:MAG: Translation initiation factor IF-1 [Candidatus Kuenenbacteria bacterium GW2011_GWA2_42_15]|uniref:Translation initiation factor IF-1 n=4 Tax=Candidatus Kueneniibacteriota TaxID=1752740 RepID=A0A0G0YW19_9BACT|nr:MAG: Translation initiation factor IF-1 [Candidatus Kuenenbacteria bacterium GW2011_GWA2_42_15]
MINNDQNNPASQSVQLGVNRKGFIEMDGEIIELLPAASFRVKLDNGQEILGHLSGRMRMNNIMLLTGDRVKIEVSPYDLGKGRIIYRY